MMTENFKAVEYLSLTTYPAAPTIQRLGDLRAPTLVVIGSLDGKSLRNIAGTMAQQIPGAREIVVDGASHHPPVETPLEFNRILLDVLARADAAKR
jgi:pimeloyl-ACP methyl ester carboxylesterase